TPSSSSRLGRNSPPSTRATIERLIRRSRIPNRGWSLEPTLCKPLRLATGKPASCHFLPARALAALAGCPRPRPYDPRRIAKCDTTGENPCGTRGESGTGAAARAVAIQNPGLPTLVSLPGDPALTGGVEENRVRTGFSSGTI